MGIVTWILLGLLAGVLAKLIMPGHDPGGLVVTALLGMAGALVGGFISTQLGYGDVSGLDLRGLAIAVGGSVILLWLLRLWRRRGEL